MFQKGNLLVLMKALGREHPLHAWVYHLNVVPSEYTCIYLDNLVTL